MKRKIDQVLLEWKADQNRMPLIVKGARQVGKTKSIERFANQCYECVVEINFVENPEYKMILEGGYSPESIVKNITRINPKTKFTKKKTLIFFDEIQEFPDIVTALKFFALDGNYDVVCSGSLLSTHYKEITSISVGYKTEIELKSLDFEEFLWALRYTDSTKQDILSHMLSFKPFSPLEFDVYNGLFADYCIVGGMPQAVSGYVKNRNFSHIPQIQDQIVIGYEADIRKYALGLAKARIANVFRSIPFQLGKENKKFQISKIRPGARFSDYRGVLEWLEDAGIINISRPLQTPSFP